MHDESPNKIVERERELRDREAPEYDRDRSVWEIEVTRHAVLGLLDLHPGQTLLDAGAGTGLHVPGYLAAGASVIAVDHSEQSLALAQERVRPEDRERFRSVPGDLRELPLEDSSVDRAVCLGVLQHIPTDEFRLQAVRELCRCLKPGGVLVVVAYRWLGHVKRHKEGWWSPELYRYAFTVRELGELLRRGGFSDPIVGGLGVLPGLPEPLRPSGERQAALAFTPVGRLLGQHVIARAVRPV
jgi:ubiquinone/menaquinone biosynthesis C-methylase UbiE